MEMKNENIVTLIEELIDLKVRQAILVKDLADDKSFAQLKLDCERMQQVKVRLVNALDGQNN